MGSDRKNGIRDSTIPMSTGDFEGHAVRRRYARSDPLFIVSRLLPPGSIGDDVAILAQERLDDLEDPRVAMAALHETAPIEHLVAKWCRLLRGIPTIVGRVLLEDPFDIGTECGHLICVEDGIEHNVSVRLEALRRGRNGPVLRVRYPKDRVSMSRSCRNGRRRTTAARIRAPAPSPDDDA